MAFLDPMSGDYWRQGVFSRENCDKILAHDIEVHRHLMWCMHPSQTKTAAWLADAFKSRIWMCVRMGLMHEKEAMRIIDETSDSCPALPKTSPPDPRYPLT